MPQTSTLGSPGCPPLHALTTDSLGLVKVVEVRGKGGGTPQIVETWGPPDASRGVLATSFADRKKDPIEFLNPLKADVLTTIKANESGPTDQSSSANDPIIGLHFIKSKHEDSSIEFSNPFKGDVLTTVKANESEPTDQSLSANDLIIGLHFIKSKHEDSSAMLGALLTCTEKRKSLCQINSQL